MKVLLKVDLCWCVSVIIVEYLTNLKFVKLYSKLYKEFNHNKLQSMQLNHLMITHISCMVNVESFQNVVTSDHFTLILLQFSLLNVNNL